MKQVYLFACLLALNVSFLELLSYEEVLEKKGEERDEIEWVNRVVEAEFRDVGTTYEICNLFPSIYEIHSHWELIPIVRRLYIVHCSIMVYS